MSQPVMTQPQQLFVSSLEADWASGICDCCDDKKQCCFAFWCCPCFACRTTKQFGQCLCLPLLDVFGCVHPITMSIRVSLRQRYGIKVRPRGESLYRLFVLHLLSALRLVSNGHRDEEAEAPHHVQ
ncbi:cornifelin homolog B isoform X2 [Oreochromis niloticus]|uniref:cornifelin homolog B isoform X2 n=1 Tax=Oreochromis niloticus TaxID=8128 RepID=UPI000393D7DD|nr:cornifelin homolog B isoform X2 [Oreochromis niloticus]